MNHLGLQFKRHGCKRLVVLCALASGISLSGQDVDPFLIDDSVLQSVEEWAKENLDESVLEALSQVDRDKVRDGLKEIERRFQGDSVYDLGALKVNATSLLPILQQFEETEPLAEWLQTRLDYLDAADQLKQALPALPSPKPNTPPPTTPAVPPAPTLEQERTVWTKQLETRIVPPQAGLYLGKLKPIFASEKVPSEMVWLAEIESSFSPKAKSPSGATGMFQLMKPTAKRFGLSTSFPDERRNPEKSARAAATYLHYLFEHYGDWRLALAAYNAGEGRVDALLKKTGGKSYAAIAHKLPAETQMYVPKFEATLKKREGLALADLKLPKA